MTRPRVGISRCLLGDDVRYDGSNKRDRALIEELGAHVEWVPVCPEVEVGMGTPREPIQLVRASDGALAAEGLSGFVLKRDSPSCGLEGVRVRDEHAGDSQAEGRGLFAQALIELLPALPVEDEERLHAASERAEFLQRVGEYHVRIHGSG